MMPKPLPDKMMAIERNSVKLPAVGWLDTMTFPAALGISENANTGKLSMLK